MRVQFDLDVYNEKVGQGIDVPVFTRSGKSVTILTTVAKSTYPIAYLVHCVDGDNVYTCDTKGLFFSVSREERVDLFMEVEWKPKYGETYWHIGELYQKVYSDVFLSCPMDYERLNTYRAYPTKEQAKEALKRITAFIAETHKDIVK